MNIESFRDYCISKPGVTEGFPFDNKVLVFKVMGKMFALTDIDEFEYFNVKCDPQRALELRDRYDGIRPGYHMDKKTWNSVYIHQGIPEPELFQFIDDSYELIVAGLTKKKKEELMNLDQ